MAGVILPVAKALYLCEEIDVEGGMTNLYALFNAIHPDRYPHRQESFICFAQLLGGLGEVPFHVDVRRAEDNQLIYWTGVRALHFPDRSVVLQLAVTITGCVFERPGVHLVELYCDNTWVADTTVRLLEAEP
jgi:hypothetical protein